MDLLGFLTWVGSSGGNIAIVSWIAERVPAFQKLAANVKQIAFFGTSFVLSLAAYLVLTQVSPELLKQLAPYFGLLYTTFSTVFVANGFHRLDKLT